MREEYFIGLLSSLVVNYSMRAPKRGAVPGDFMPSEVLKGKRRNADEISGEEEVASVLRQVLANVPGAVFTPGK